MKANHLAVSLFLHAGAVAAAMSISSAAKRLAEIPAPEKPARVVRVTAIAPLVKRMRPKLAQAVRPPKPSIPVLPVPASPVERQARQFNPPAPIRIASATPPNLTQPIVAIPDAAVVQSQSPLSNQPAAVALPPPQLKVGGIGEVHAGAAPGPSTAITQARTTGSFGDAKIAQQAPRPATPTTAGERAPAQSFPMEILSKPRPIYTEEARRLHIQGEVLLEVAFRATGEVQILRTVRGLGHGLDEAAEEAARQIRFRPARRGESAVDATAVVHIAFELAY